MDLSQERTVTQEKNANLVTEFEEAKSRIAKEILASVGIPLSTREQMNYIQSLLNYRSMPGQEGQQHFSNMSQSKMETNFIFPSVSRSRRDDEFVDTKGQKIKRDSEVIVVHREKGEGDWTTTVDIYHPADSQNDRMYMHQLHSGRQQLTNDLGIQVNPRDKVNLVVHLMYPKGVTPDNDLLNFEVPPDGSSINIKLRKGEIPFTQGQISEIDLLTDKRKKELHHPNRRYLEIREVTVNKLLKEALSDLPEDSSLRKIATGNEDFISRYIYDSLKNYGIANFEESKGGYIFEALFLLELLMKDPENSLSSLKKAIFSQVNRGRKVEGQDFDYQSTDFKDLNEQYQKYFTKRGMSHGDFIITETINGKKVISAILECKINPGPIQPTNIEQASKSISNLPEFIASLPDRRDYLVPNEKTTKAIIVKPSTTGFVDSAMVKNGMYIGVVRSEVGYEDLMTVWKKIAPPESKEEPEEV